MMPDAVQQLWQRAGRDMIRDMSAAFANPDGTLKPLGPAGTPVDTRTTYPPIPEAAKALTAAMAKGIPYRGADAYEDPRIAGWRSTAPVKMGAVVNPANDDEKLSLPISAVERSPKVSTLPPPAPDTFAQRFSPAEPRLSETFRSANLPNMEHYYEPSPHEQRQISEAAMRDAARQYDANQPAPPRLFGEGASIEDQDVKPYNPVGDERAYRNVQTAASFINPLESPSAAAATALMFIPGIGWVTRGALWGASMALDPDEAEAAGGRPRGRLGGGAGRYGGPRGYVPERNWRMAEVVDPEGYNPRAVIGGNAPPAEYRMSPQELSAAFAEGQPMSAAGISPAAANRLWMSELPRPSPADTSTAIPNIRNMPVADAIEIARTQPHLIEAGEGSPGKYVGGPEGIQSKATLNAQRRAFDEMIAADPRGGDWYDRYRAGQNITTGGDPVQNLWQSAQHGQFSAGVSPEHELNLALKENNASIAGMPYKAGTPAQHEAHLRAIAAKDPMLYQLGEKTGEYQVHVNPDQPGIPAGGTATGVNDFRQGNVHGYPEGYDKAFTSAQHKYLDYETALAVDRANQSQLGGRSDWTGEKLQAIPWVIDKARALMSRNADLTYEQAMRQALKTVVDYYPKHTYFATHEAQPGADVVGHLAGSVNAPQSVRDQFALDPRSSWANAPMGRDAIYAGLGVKDTGNYMRVLPSQPMQGIYDTPAGTTEYNLGQVARPLGAFQAPARDPETKKVIDKTAPFKRTADAESTILNAGEALRGYIDAQNASTWHKAWFGGPNKESTSLFFPRNTPATAQELKDIRAVARQYGLGDVADTGQGITVTSFGGVPPVNKDLDRELRKAGGAFEQFGTPIRARVDSGYIGYEDKWQQPGSGTATRQMLEYVTKTPELRDAFNRNEFIGKNALARMERDEAWASRWGAPREDIQRAREIIGKGPGWVDRLEQALKQGVLLPATVAAIFAGAKGAQEGEDRGQL